MSRSHPDIRRHPQYPFREERRRGLAAAGRNFLGAPREGSDEAAILGEFLQIVDEFAFLERLIQGDILYELPVHPAVVAMAAPAAAEGERLASEERALLPAEDGLVIDLPEALDDMGIKVLRLDPDGGEPSGAPLFGAFHFEGETGPALLVGADPARAEAAFVLAHEFGHLIADVDPYRARCCRWEPGTLRNLAPSPEEERADRFARALLLPDEQVREACSDLGRTGAPTLEQLAGLFEVPPVLVALRLAEIGLEEAVTEAEPGAAGSLTGPPAGAARRIGLPERFVNLALAAYSERVLESVELARFLRITPEEAERMIGWAGVPRLVERPAWETGEEESAQDEESAPGR